MSSQDEPSGPQRVGRYLLFGQIAAGGMASVYLGRAESAAGPGSTLAIKQPHPHLVAEGEFLAMLLDEARVAARLRHPNVVRTYEAVWADGQALLVMEYVHGVALSVLLRRSQALGEAVPSTIAATLARDMLRGLHAAHEAVDARNVPLGIVHRDVSPQNILVSEHGVGKVADFGIAKAAGRILQTQEGEVKGKLAYMAPEQLNAGAVDRRADVYSAAIVTWEMLTGRSLFLDENGEVIVSRLLEHRAQAPSEIVAGVPRAWDAIVLRGLARDPRHRFGTAEEMARAIETSVPLASADEVRVWLSEIAADVLAQRAAMRAAVERPDLERTMTAFAAASVHEGGASRRGAETRARAWMVVGATSVALLGLAIGTVRARVDGTGAVAVAQAAAPAAMGVPAPTPPPPLAIVATTMAGARESAPAPTSESAPAPRSESESAPAPSNARAAARPASAPGARRAVVTPRCSPPYDLDARGVRHYKPECL